MGAPRSNGIAGSADGTVFVSRLGALTAAVDDATATDEDVPVSAAVLRNDGAGPEGSLDPAAVDVTLLYPPQHGTATLDRATGSITYTPATNFNGQDSFSYVAGWGLPASVTVSVAPIPDPPRFTTTAPQAAVEARPYRYQIGAADPDEGDVPQVTASTLPAWLTLTPKSAVRLALRCTRISG